MSSGITPSGTSAPAFKVAAMSIASPSFASLPSLIKSAIKATLIDEFPNSVNYIEGSLRINDIQVNSYLITGNKINIELGKIDPGSQLVVEYKIKTISKNMPLGSYGAEIKVIEPETGITHNSNPVIYK